MCPKVGEIALALLKMRKHQVDQTAQRKEELRGGLVVDGGGYI